MEVPAGLLTIATVANGGDRANEGFNLDKVPLLMTFIPPQVVVVRNKSFPLHSRTPDPGCRCISSRTDGECLWPGNSILTRISFATRG